MKKRQRRLKDRCNAIFLFEKKKEQKVIVFFFLLLVISTFR
jgi:hypothetical protein